MSFFNELKRRNVFRVGVAYVIISWLLAQVADLMLENFGAPPWVMKTFLGFLLIGFPLALLFAWAFELTPDGVKREKDVPREVSITTQTGQKLNRSIMLVMALALAWFAWEKFGSSPEAPQQREQAGAVNTKPVTEQSTVSKSIAVLPFVAMSSGPDDEYFADGLTLVATWCACGAPWELSATPNYAATIKAAGLPWPPASPINFPLKDW